MFDVASPAENLSCCRQSECLTVLCMNNHESTSIQYLTACRSLVTHGMRITAAELSPENKRAHAILVHPILGRVHSKQHQRQCKNPPLTSFYLTKNPDRGFATLRFRLSSNSLELLACLRSLGAMLSSTFLATRYTVDPTLSSLGPRF